MKYEHYNLPIQLLLLLLGLWVLNGSGRLAPRLGLEQLTVEYVGVLLLIQFALMRRRKSSCKRGKSEASED